ncbi:MAG TPA: SAM-dependent methyltransferase, partial [Candidatus Sulfotelmatobacter sp.]|nr:SAM-dependent methyltransferase [Candidatus Sulfotelmatobacter sp.]
MADQSPATKPEPQILETDVPLSRSIIWRLQRDYYAQRGLEAWSQDLVPSYITNNPFIAEIYAGVVAAFIEDCLRQSAGAFSAVAPLRILELGAGTGKFAYLFLHKLTPLLREKNIPAQAVRYTMTDCSDPLLARWRANPYLGEFVQSGVLNFELLSAGEAGNSSSLSENSSTSKPAAPLVVIANYVFDSLPQDAFVISHGEICEALVTAGSPAGAVQSPGGLQLSFKNVSLTAPRYSEPSWNAILEHYRSSLPAATIFFPSAALTLLQQLSHSSDGRMLVLAADKGFAHEEELSLIKGEPPLEFHAVDRCFSAQVNLDAMARYFASTGGEVLLPPKHSTNLNICGFLMRRSKDEFPAIRRAYHQALTAFGPDDLFTLMSWLHSYLESVSVPQALAVLRLTRWDPTALLRLFPVIAKQLRNASAERNDLQQAVLSTWANHYPVTAADNALAFSCGVILLELRFYAEAMAMFKISEQQLGPSASTSYNLGLCAIG